MAHNHESSRKPKAGIIMIATLVSLILVMGLAVLVQSTTLANTKVLKRLSSAQEQAPRRDALRSLLRPLVGEVMMGQEDNAFLSVDGAATPVAYEGKTYLVQLYSAGDSSSSQRIEISLQDGG